MIVIGDLHIKEHPLYKKAVLSFLGWLYDNYKDETIIQLGDFFDSSSINHSLMLEVANILKNFNELHILTGNHDQSRRMNNILKNFNNYDNIFIYEDKATYMIDRQSCLFLPYKYNMSDYEEIEGEWDFIFPHFTPKQESFGKEFIDISKIKGQKVYGHIHNYAVYDDAFILGVPVITRNGESNNPILSIVEKKITEIHPPIFFQIQNLSYGQPIENFDWLYNIINAPSIKSVYEMYPSINIREGGVSVLYTNSDDKELTFNNIDTNLKTLFMDYCREKEIETIYQNEGLQALEILGVSGVS
jgi:hypothetical protein